MIIRRNCPFCTEGFFKVEKWGKNNLYLLSCQNKNTVASKWVQLHWTKERGYRFQEVAVNKHPAPKASMSSYQKQQYDKLQVPFWKMMGLQPKAEEIAEEKELKRRGMTYGDAVLERSQGGDNSSGINRFNRMREEANVNKEYQKV